SGQAKQLYAADYLPAKSAAFTQAECWTGEAVDSLICKMLALYLIRAGVAKLAYAADSKSKVCFLCPLLNSSELLESVNENDRDTLSPFAGLLSHFEAF